MNATAQQQSPGQGIKTAATVTGWLLTAVFGSGWYWQYKSAALEQRKEDSAELTQRLSLRDQTTQKLLAVVPLIQSGKACSSPDVGVTIRALVSDLTEFERQLAVLEKREPRTNMYGEINRPCPPTGLTVN